MLGNINARRHALARVLGLRSDLVAYTEKVRCFVVRRSAEFYATPIYWVFTPPEAEAERAIGRLDHRAHMAEILVGAQCYYVFCGRT